MGGPGLALNAADRFETAAEFADALDAWVVSFGLKPSAKSLASVISPLFESERLRMRKTIEEQISLSKLRGAARTGSGTLPSIRPGAADNTSAT
jgi:hypothetical protein